MRCGETPRLKVKGFRGRPWNLCLNDDCPSMVEMREKRAERQAAKEAREAAKAAAAAENGEVPADSKGDAKAANIYASAFSQNPEFFSFYRSMEAYRSTFRGRNDLMLLESNSDFLRYFRDSLGKTPPAPARK